MPRKFPNIKLAISEGGIGWIAAALERADRQFQKHRLHQHMDDLLPSEVWHRNIWGCMIDEPIGLKSRYDIGIDKILWECDYPHCDSTWPHSQKLVEEFMGDLPDEEITAITHGNAEKLFRWKIGVGAGQLTTRQVVDMETPKIISVDDHVVEPPTLWQDRLPAKYREIGPRVVRKRGQMTFEGGKLTFAESPDAPVVDLWHYEDLVWPIPRGMAQVGHLDDLSAHSVNYDDIAPGCWQQGPRLADLTANHTDGSLSFPSFPRFCGQTFLERKDKELALLCVQAYNDWMIDEWCAGAGAGILIPLTLIPLWDPELAAAEVRRCADKGSFAVAFSENPVPLGLPSIHGPHWDPFLAACEET